MEILGTNLTNIENNFKWNYARFYWLQTKFSDRNSDQRWIRDSKAIRPN